MKEYKHMLGATIAKYRKGKGLSQQELGDLVGVSNRAVSKWENYEANPDISILTKLAKVFDITTDELLSEINKKDPLYKEARVLGFNGVFCENNDHYEFISNKKTKKDIPYLHINIGKQIHSLNAKARGVIAIGNNAKGVFALGLISCGVFSLGLISLGLLAFSLISFGLISIGLISLGILSIGTIAIGLIAIGLIAIGYYSFGMISIGYYAYTISEGIAIGKYTTYIDYRQWVKSI